MKGHDFPAALCSASSQTPAIGLCLSGIALGRGELRTPWTRVQEAGALFHSEDEVVWGGRCLGQGEAGLLGNVVL